MTGHLRENEKMVIVELLDGWLGPLSWTELIERIERSIGRRYTKEGLRKHPEILSAWNAAKLPTRQATARRERSSSSPVVDVLKSELALRDAKIDRLEREKRVLEERLWRWANNAVACNVDPARLDKPLVVPVGRKPSPLDRRR